MGQGDEDEEEQTGKRDWERKGRGKREREEEGREEGELRAEEEGRKRRKVELRGGARSGREGGGGWHCGRDDFGADDGLEIHAPDEEMYRLVLTCQMGTRYPCMS